MGKHIAVFGVGAVGGFVAGRLALAGEDVVLIDPWWQHIEYMKSNGIHLLGTDGEKVIPVKCMHIHEVQSLIRKPLDIAIICTKSYDTEWAATMLQQYLAPQGYVVSMQNGINEERVAGVVGWGKTVGCILSTIGVDCQKPGHILRIREPRGDKYTVFRVGEVHGRVTRRATELASILSAVDCSMVTTNLWGERWTKLTANSIAHALLGATGYTNDEVFLKRGKPHRLGVRLAAEAIAVGRAQGYDVGTVLGINPDDWCAAAAGNSNALTSLQNGLVSWVSTLTEPSPSSMGRDVARGRRSEVDYTNGLVVAKGEEIGVPAPTHAVLSEIVRRIDRGELKASPSNLDGVDG